MTVAAHQQEADSWMTCRARALNATSPEDMPPADSIEASSEVDGCIGEWILTNHFAPTELYAQQVDSAAECVAKCKTDDYADYDLANVQ